MDTSLHLANEKFHWPPSSNEFHTNRHPSLAKLGRSTDRLHQQTASWNLNAMDMNEIIMTNFRGRIHILQNSNLFAHTLLSSSISDCQNLQKQTSDSWLEHNQTKLQSQWSTLPGFPQIIKAKYIQWNEVFPLQQKTKFNVTSYPEENTRHNTCTLSCNTTWRQNSTKPNSRYHKLFH